MIVFPQYELGRVFAFLSLDASYTSLDSIVCFLTTSPLVLLSMGWLPPILGWICMYVLYYFLSDSHEHSFSDFDRPSIPSCVDLWECLVLTKRECVYIICHRRMPETSILHGLPSQHTTPLYFVRCY